jgi:O-antigen ligase
MNGNADLSPAILYRAVDSHALNSAALSITPAIGVFFSVRTVIILVAVRVFVIEPRSGATISLGVNFILLLLVWFYTFGPQQRSFRSILLLKPIRWVFAFLFFSGLSLTWTAADSLGAAVAFWGALSADVLMIALLLRPDSIGETARSLMKGYVAGACVVALTAWILPAQSDLRLGDEELLGPNQIGYVCALGLLFGQYLVRSRLRFWILPSALLALTLLRSLSKTSIAAFVVGEVCMLLFDRSSGMKSKLTMIGTAALGLILFSGLIGAYYSVYTNAGSQAETLTGRIGLWAYFLEESFNKPWVGHGFHSVWKVVPLFAEGFEARHAHNEIIQQFYAYGAAGVFLFLGLYGSLGRQIWRSPSGFPKAFSIAMLVFALVRGLADTEPFDLSLPLWAVILLSAMLSDWTAQNATVASAVEGGMMKDAFAGLQVGRSAQ